MNKPKEEKKLVAIRMPKSLYAILRKLSELEGRTFSETTIKILTQSLDL